MYNNHSLGTTEKKVVASHYHMPIKIIALNIFGGNLFFTGFMYSFIKRIKDWAPQENQLEKSYLCRYIPT